MSDIKPGFYVATVRGAPGVRGVVTWWGSLLFTTAEPPRVQHVAQGYVTDLRPLVTLDPETDGGLMAAAMAGALPGVRVSIAQGEAVIRALLPPSPRPPEPTGLGAVVRDAEGEVWVSVVPLGKQVRVRWWAEAVLTFRDWDDIDVRSEDDILSPGWSE